MYSDKLCAGSGSGRNDLMRSDSDLTNLFAQYFEHVKYSVSAAYD